MYQIESNAVFPYFLGDWTVQRVISGFGEISGQAKFKPSTERGECLDYKEAMVLPNSPNQQANAFRLYEYRITESGFDIFFADGATNGDLFLSFAFTQASLLTCHHLCIKDHYDATFEFLSENVFELSFTVDGPKKDYSIHTRFTRQ